MLLLLPCFVADFVKNNHFNLLLCLNMMITPIIKAQVPFNFKTDVHDKVSFIL